MGNVNCGARSITIPTSSYGYDTANRLQTASDSGGWSRRYGYDIYGNMWVGVAQGIGLSPATATSNIYNPATNQKTNETYDAAGNQRTMGGTYSLVYDAENRQVSETNTVGNPAAQYLYDGDGHRVQKTVGATATTYVYDALGQLTAEYTNTPAGTPPCQTCYLSYDHLGSTRMVTDEAAHVVSLHDYLPFGEEISGNSVGRGALFGAGADQVNQKFTGQERDPETGLDFFQARYYGSALGRFTSPDPANAGANPADPQSWNAYAYVDNSPLVFTDPSGMNLFTSLWNGISNWFAGGGGSELARCMSFGDSGSCGSSTSGANPDAGGGDGGSGGAMFTATGLGKADVPTVGTSPNNGTKTCANGVGSGGIGLGGGYNLDLGVGLAGASSTGGAGAGAFHNKGGGFTSGYSGGAFASSGATAYAGSRVVGAPTQSSSTVFALGAYAGAGANLFISNAASVQQLSGPFTTLSVNVGVGVANMGVQLSTGGGIWQLSVTPPIASLGIGFAGSVVTTNTVATHTGCH